MKSGVHTVRLSTVQLAWVLGCVDVVTDSSPHLTSRDLVDGRARLEAAFRSDPEEES